MDRESPTPDGAPHPDAPRRAAQHTDERAPETLDSSSRDSEQQLRARLDAADRRVNAVMQGASDLVLIQTDLSRRVIAWSAGAERILGWRADEMIGQSADRIFTPEDRADGIPDQEARGALRDGRALDERWHVRRDGTLFWGSGTTNVELGADGRPIGFVKLMKDLTERRAFEEHLRTTNRLKDEFLATLAHELRNPLAPIRSALTVIARAGPLTDAQQRAVGIAERQLHNMVRLVDDLLEVSRVTSGKLALQKQPTRLQDALDSALEMVRPGVDAAGHELDVDMPAHGLYVDGDPVRLAQLFGNLLNNSVKYTPPGGRIRVRVQTRGDGAEVMVQDNGTGIDKDVLPTVFDLFAQADRSIERQAGGLGIGLALVKRIVEMHGGTVAADSRGAGHGSTFRVWLPIVPAPQGDAANAEARERGDEVRRRVLVVDDNVDAADTLAALLLTEGHEVREAHDGACALEQVQEFEPDVVFMDIGLPQLDGLEITRRIRALPLRRQPRIVALTGWNQEADRERSRRAGIDAHLAKPADATAIRRALGGLH